MKMKDKLDEALVKDFPNLYRDRHTDMMTTCMCWGFPGDGWEPLIRKLSAKLEKLILDLPEDDRKECCASQVKEKFGTLRFYMSSSNKEMEALIDEAEAESAVTCEHCSAPGKLRQRSWWLTLCDTCDTEWEKSRAERTQKTIDLVLGLDPETDDDN